MAALFVLLVGGALGSMYDVNMPLYKSTCTNGCLPWADAAKSLSPHLNLTRELRHGSKRKRCAKGCVDQTESNFASTHCAPHQSPFLLAGGVPHSHMWRSCARVIPGHRLPHPSAEHAINSMFILGAEGSAAAGSMCAMPGATAGAHEQDCGLYCDPHGVLPSLSLSLSLHLSLLFILLPPPLSPFLPR
jgi:hypothetical protein